MTEAINFFQTLFSINNFANVSRHESKLAKALIKDAKSLVETAEAEAAHGATAQNLMREAERNQNETLKLNMATIAAWHFERSLEKFQKAAARYNEAGRIQTKNSRVFFAEAKAVAKRADEIAAEIKN